ncbi:2-oxoacid:acceptor oxidoreductase subunit alpha [Clostridium beijerinckii]|uniref:2-oxoglutarate ferredoxin oxidoreductase subunit alpha n=1 Tax=Clostridium beijerinckii TaxID=1520 RepID=A0A9Q5GIC8_CLOBE|nr:2-oxoacid:acceptor oxidoreductase subunit alpha [Clostridium beijerinckii]AQS06403.1 2-oxoglutarate oxidoreductase subunit KorA [Clostridium beijerinckii]MBA2885779.1 2-oxoglutarate ferredoxin oxidoreductase subunit alpha [Clostridium beijerinckii]MBA2900520.1 2-oxoglutarate ferredoxin oxidoreductase subunit alpha [Clostridium beijerinckii]MBA2910338.1 2-oxoglutarate ferredoxin oxidoreductase subunit alpha [Clostridium beijerinckii]MBA9013978.1 2-oxoglutarate ferredoxin oxidoreductase subun
MNYNILIGGAAGQGVDTTASILEKLLKKSGYSVFTVKDLMSRVRGGHNFSLIRFGTEEVLSHTYEVDGIIALNEDTAEFHKDKLKKNGFILSDSDFNIDDDRAIKVPMKKIAKELGNPKVTGTIAVGAAIKLFGIENTNIEEALKSSVKERFLDVNIKAAMRGYDSVESKFSAQPGSFSDYLILNGNTSLALGAIAAGLKFYSAYPMSPSTSILEYLASISQKADVLVEQAEDEIAAINMAIGASFAGARAMTGTSGGGFCLKVEALGLSGMAEIPLVVVDVQRPGPTTGLPTRTEQSDLKFVISASQGEFPRMVIAIRTIEDAFYQTIRAFNMAEKYQIPVTILSDQYLGDGIASVKPFDLNRVKVYKPAEVNIKDGEYLRYKITEDGVSPRLIPGKTKNFVTADSDEHDEMGRITESAEVRNEMMDKRMRKLSNLKLDLEEPEFFGDEDCDNLLLGWGSTYGVIKEAVKLLNRRNVGSFGALLFGDVYPLPQKKLNEKAKVAKKIIDIEQNATGQLADLIREQTGINCDYKILKYDGRQISANEIVDRIIKEV